MSVPVWKHRAVRFLLATLLILPSAVLAFRIRDCPGGRYAPKLSSAVGLPFEDPSSPTGSFTVIDGAITLGACPDTAAPFSTLRYRRIQRARWQTCGPFRNVQLRLQFGPGGVGEERCRYLIGVVQYREPSGRLRGIKFPADLIGP